MRSWDQRARLGLVDRQVVEQILGDVEHAVLERFFDGIPRPTRNGAGFGRIDDKAVLSSCADVTPVLTVRDEMLAAERPGLALIQQGGKRWRPLLLVLVCRLCGGDQRQAVEIAAAVELAHSGSLIIDDIEDGADLRRGEPTAHHRFGLDAAVNGGNLLYCVPGQVFASAGLSAELELQMHRLYWQALVRLHYGQGLDISWHRDRGRMPNVDEYMAMCRLKSGSTSGLAARLGAMLAGVEPGVCDSLGKAGEDFGVCFQIIDDVRNLMTGNPGKMRGDDLVEGKKSLPLLLAMSSGDREASRLQNLLEEIEHADSGGRQPLIEEAIALMQSVTAIDRARRMAAQRYRDTRDRMHDLPVVDGPALDALLTMTDRLLA